MNESSSFIRDNQDSHHLTEQNWHLSIVPVSTKKKKIFLVCANTSKSNMSFSDLLCKGQLSGYSDSSTGKNVPLIIIDTKWV